MSCRVLSTLVLVLSVYSRLSSLVLYEYSSATGIYGIRYGSASASTARHGSIHSTAQYTQQLKDFQISDFQISDFRFPISDFQDFNLDFQKISRLQNPKHIISYFNFIICAYRRLKY